MEDFVDLVAPRNLPDLLFKAFVLVGAFTAFDYFVDLLTTDMVAGNVAAGLFVTFLIGAPFGLFVMGIMAIQRRLKTQLRHFAQTDHLTGLLNRQAFMEKAEIRLRHDPDPMVLMMDLDRFKAVNDTHGHFIGDLCLRLVGEHLRQHLSPDDLVGRIGGEEFAIVLSRSSIAETEAVVQSICQPIPITAANDFHSQIPAFDLTMSIGAVFALPGQGMTELLRFADDALYRAKDAGRARIVFYDAKQLQQPQKQRRAV